MKRTKTYYCARCKAEVESDEYPPACQRKKDGEKKRCACGQWIPKEKEE